MSEKDSEFSFEFKPELLNFPKDIILKITDELYDGILKINDVPEIQGVGIFTYDGSQVLNFARTDLNFENMKTVGSVLASLEPIVYFKDLSGDFEYGGTGHLELEDFELFIAKIHEDTLLVVMATDPTSQLFQVAQKFSDGLCKIIELSTKKSDEEKIKEISTGSIGSVQSKKKEEVKKPKLKSKKDLKDELRSKLDEL